MKTRSLWLAGWIALALAPLAAAAEPFDWNGVAGERVPRIVTTNEDGSEKWTKLWLVVVADAGYVRTGNSRWFRNIERNPEVKLEIGGGVHAVRAEAVTDPGMRDRVTRAMREKYGWQDVLVHPFGSGDSNILRLVPHGG